MAWLRDQPLPARGRPVAELLADIEAHVLPYPMGNGHPRFFGWVNSPPEPAGVLVEPIAAAMNPSCAGGDHAAVAVERCVVRWLAGLVGYPCLPGSGLLTSGTSLATISGLAAARYRAAADDGWDVRADGLAARRRFTVYVSAEGHSCVRKAAELLGIGARGVRVVGIDEEFRMDTAALRAAVARDRADGLRPFAVAATAGTVNSGAIDPLDQLADIAAEQGLWLHVDGAYGALGSWTTRSRPATRAWPGRTRSRWIRTSGSACPSTAAACWSASRSRCGRRSASCRRTCRTTRPTAPAGSPNTGRSRPARSARCGPGPPCPTSAGPGSRACVARAVALARTLAGMIDPRRRPGTGRARGHLDRRVPVPPAGPGREPGRRRQPAIPVAVQRRGRAFLTGTLLAGRHALRACLIHPDTTSGDLAILLDEMRTAGIAITRR